MTPGEFREFARAMREFGLSHVKMGDVEISMGSDAVTSISNSLPNGDTLSIKNGSPAYSSSTIPMQPDPVEHKVEQLQSLLKLNDTDLVDQLFPDHTQDEESA